jgi:GTP-binding protein EngB required for normal cell division
LGKPIPLIQGVGGVERPRNEPQASDVYVAVMGVTGAGKSTFISHLADEQVLVGNGLNACASQIRSLTFWFRN